MNTALLVRLADKRGEAQLRSICLALNRKVDTLDIDRNPGKRNMLELVNYGIEHPVRLKQLAEVFKI